VCLENNARSRARVQETRSFALSILSGAQVEAGKQFAYDRDARSAPTKHAAAHISARGELLFDDALGYFECVVTAEYEGGDHSIFLAKVVRARAGVSKSPLIYFEGEWHALSPENALIPAPPQTPERTRPRARPSRRRRG
jgi:flavin reductase (DIM6/NTAB) family NADH-FMN oxidoreductase RutF